MEPVTLNIDSSHSKIVLRTHATGMLARLAHDLELTVTEIRGHAVREDAGFSGELTIAVEAIRVTGQLHGERLDPLGISSSDRAEIERKLREEVFVGTKEIHVRGHGSAWSRGHFTVETKRGQTEVALSLQGAETDGQIRITGQTEVSLAKLGVREIKGPLGAFKVKDAVEVRVEIILQPAG